MKNKVFFIAIMQFIFFNVNGQAKIDLRKLELTVVGFYKTEIGKRYINFKYNGGGTLIMSTLDIHKGQKSSLKIGVFDMLSIGSGKGFISGGNGFSISNKLGSYIGGERYFFKDKFKFNLGTYLAWESIKRKGVIDLQPIFQNEEFEYSINQFSIDFEVKFGFRLTQKTDLILTSIYEITRLLDFDGVLEYPFISSGIGVKYKFNQ